MHIRKNTKLKQTWPDMLLWYYLKAISPSLCVWSCLSAMLPTPKILILTIYLSLPQPYFHSLSALWRPKWCFRDNKKNIYTNGRLLDWKLGDFSIWNLTWINGSQMAKTKMLLDWSLVLDFASYLQRRAWKWKCLWATSKTLTSICIKVVVLAKSSGRKVRRVTTKSQSISYICSGTK